jgi:hypothetical protein
MKDYSTAHLQNRKEETPNLRDSQVRGVALEVAGIPFIQLNVSFSGRLSLQMSHSINK